MNIDLFDLLYREAFGSYPPDYGQMKRRLHEEIRTTKKKRFRPETERKPMKVIPLTKIAVPLDSTYIDVLIKDCFENAASILTDHGSNERDETIIEIVREYMDDAELFVKLRKDANKMDAEKERAAMIESGGVRTE